MEGGEEEKVEESRVEAAAAGGRVDACETEWCHCDEAELLFCLSCNVPIVLPSCSSLPPVRRGTQCRPVGLFVSSLDSSSPHGHHRKVLQMLQRKPDAQNPKSFNQKKKK